MRRFYPYLRTVLLIVAVAMSLASAPRRKPYSSHEKAFYADAQTVEFVKPGLTITINSASIAADGTISTTYSLTDPSGLPLDSAGVTTPGTVSVSFIAAVLPNGPDAQYTAYTTRVASGAAIATENQPGADSGGATTSSAAGVYTYTFHTKAPSGFDATATHTIGVYGSRSLTTFNLGTDYASATFDFVPNGSKVTEVRDVIRTAACNGCHDQLSAHGGSRRGMAMCVLCHTPQNADANTGNSLDMKVMIHKIHDGSSLPSVVAGKPYQIIGFQNSVNDFSKVVFPADVRRCQMCHSQTDSATQATAYLTKPERVACGSCHDDVNFATGVNHAGGPQFDDNLCANCHIPQGEMDFDASIKGGHVVPADSSLLAGLVVRLTKIQNGSAGKAPAVTFTAQDNSGKAIPLSQLSTISLTMAGPTSDYGYTSFGSDVTTPGYVTESAANATCGSDGTCLYQFTHSVPATATGTYAIGAEARRSETVLAGTTSQQSISYGATNPVMYFSVDGSPMAPRREVVAIGNCNKCHYSLTLHGGLRNNQTDYCVMCHNPSNTDASTRVTSTNAADKAAPNQGINFNLLVHRIHTGVNQPANRPYIVVGHGGADSNFSDVLYAALAPDGAPGDTRNCAMCHVNSSELNLPLGKNPVVDPQGPINPIQAISSACTGCHIDIPTASHTLLNTSTLGESCPVCHASGAAYAVDQVHAQY